jgi:hypothetical protein
MIIFKFWLHFAALVFMLGLLLYVISGKVRNALLKKILEALVILAALVYYLSAIRDCGCSLPMPK